MAQLVGVSSPRLRGWGFSSSSGTYPGWGFHPWSLVREHARRQPINISLSHQCFSLSLSLPLSVKWQWKKMSSGEDKFFFKCFAFQIINLLILWNNIGKKLALKSNLYQINLMTFSYIIINKHFLVISSPFV